MSSPGSDYRDRVAEALRAAAEYSIVGEWICCDPINPDHELCVKGDIARQMLRAVLADDEEVLFVPSKVVDVVLAVPNPELERLREENAKLLYAADPARVEAAARLVDGLTRAARTQRDDARAALARARELHVRHESNGVAWCTHCSENDYPNYQTPWPCPTIRAIEGTA